MVVRQTGRGAGPERARTKVRTGGGRRPRGGSHALVRQTGRGRGGSIDDGSSVLFSSHLAHGVSVAAGGVRGGGVGVGVRPAGHHRRAHQRGTEVSEFRTSRRRRRRRFTASPLRRDDDHHHHRRPGSSRGARGGARERRVRGLRRRGSGLGEHEPLRRGVPAVRGRAQTPRRARE